MTREQIAETLRMLSRYRFHNEPTILLELADTIEPPPLSKMAWEVPYLPLIDTPTLDG